MCRGFFMQQIKAIPVQLSREVLRRNLVKELRLLVSLKSNCSGWFCSSKLDDMFKLSSVKSRKTFERQLSRLVDMGWVYVSPVSGNYNIRSFESICRIYRVNHKKRMGYKGVDSTPRMRAYLFAGVVASRVNQIRYYYTNNAHGKTVALNCSEAFVAVTKRGKRVRRFGIGMAKVSEMIGFTRAYMVKMKRAAIRYGYLVASPIISEIRQFNDEIHGTIVFTRRGKICYSEKSVTQGGQLTGGAGTIVPSWYAYVRGRQNHRPSYKRPSDIAHLKK